MNLSVLRKDKFVVGVETPSGHFKLFQILCGRDGSLFVPFPYYKHSTAQLIEHTLRAGKVPSSVNVCGPVTLHHVKYTHHLDGEAHFSQHGKILTKVRKLANPIEGYGGHLFTVRLQGLPDFERVTDRDRRKTDRMLVSLAMPSDPASLKLVAFLYSKSALAQGFASGDNAGPWIRVVRDQRAHCAAILGVGDQADPAGRLLLLSFEEIPCTFPNQASGFSFMGGFDAPATALDHSKDTSFLMLLSSPGADPAEMARKFGSVDLSQAMVQKSPNSGGT